MISCLRRDTRCFVSSIIVLTTLCFAPIAHQALAFHLSFGHRLLRSATNPQLNPASTLIRPIECRNANNHSEVGICMFSIDCMQNKGVPLSVCKHNYFVGTCCRLPDYNNFVGIVYDLRETDQTASQMSMRKIPAAIAAQATDQQQSLNLNAPSSPLPPSSHHLAPTINYTGNSFSSRSNQDYITTTTSMATTPHGAGYQPPLESSQRAPSRFDEKRLDEKYMISSSSLFAATPTQAAMAPTTQPSIVTSGSQQQVGADESASFQAQKSANKAPSRLVPVVPSGNSGESARNSDGSAGQLEALLNSSLVNKHHQVDVGPSSEMDSFQIHSETAAAIQQSLTGAQNQNATRHHHHQQQQQHLTASSASSAVAHNQPADLAQPNQSAAVIAAVAASLVQPAEQSARPLFNAANQRYELVKEDNLDILATVNSVHSAPGAQQQFNIQQQDQQHSNNIQDQQQHQTSASGQKRPPASSLDSKSAAAGGQANSVYLLEGEYQQKQQGGVVFANNHQQTGVSSKPLVEQEQQVSASTISALRSSGQQQQACDQEFTLSSAPTSHTPEDSSVLYSTSPAEPSSLPSSSSSSSFFPSSSSPPPSSSPQTSPTPSVPHSGAYTSAATLASSSNNSATQSTQEYSHSPSTSSQAASSSSYVDLVSSHNQSQTTTPFTTSLSTAILPNVNSHPYSPTTSPPLVSNQQQQLSTRQHSSLSSTQRPHEEPAASFGFSQLYSTHSTSSTPPGQHNPTQAANDNQQRLPSLAMLGHNYFHHSTALQAASKIVSSSNAGSTANNLIPGLSSLHSAILSHIPFKIGTGLSSYLQAAMKPTGNRPLLSSNNAPALQFQQQASNNSSVRFPGSALSSGSSTPIPSGSNSSTSYSSPSGGSSQETPQLIITDNLNTGNSSGQQRAGQASHVTSTTGAPNVVRDMVKEAQQVCGQPQVSQVASDMSHKKRVGRIVGGNQSLFGQWPWMVSLRQWRKGAFLHKCGAALLNENWAITAAHCVENVKVTDLLLRLGEFDVSNQDEPYPYIERRVKSVVSHPSFDPKTFEYDLALLRFAEPIKYERNIIPVCVPSGNDSYVDRMATVIGWGRLYEDGPLPDVIQHVDVPIITNNECEKMYKNAGYIEEIPDMFICAGISKGGRDSCEGDSGGPLTMIDHDGRSYLVGIISWGIGCALPSQPGVYTRITAFSGWINQITAY